MRGCRSISTFRSDNIEILPELHRSHKQDFVCLGIKISAVHNEESHRPADKSQAHPISEHLCKEEDST